MGLVATPKWWELLWSSVNSSCTGATDCFVIWFQGLTYQCHVGASSLKIQTPIQRVPYENAYPTLEVAEGVIHNEQHFTITYTTLLQIGTFLLFLMFMVSMVMTAPNTDQFRCIIIQNTFCAHYKSKYIIVDCKRRRIFVKILKLQSILLLLLASFLVLTAGF